MFQDRSERFPSSWQLQIATPKNPATFAEIVNVSRTGLRFYSDPPLTIGDSLSFTLVGVTIRATVLRQNPDGATGANFDTPLQDQQLWTLRQYRKLNL